MVTQSRSATEDFIPFDFAGLDPGSVYRIKASFDSSFEDDNVQEIVVETPPDSDPATFNLPDSITGNIQSLAVSPVGVGVRIGNTLYVFTARGDLSSDFTRTVGGLGLTYNPNTRSWATISESNRSVRVTEYPIDGGASSTIQTPITTPRGSSIKDIVHTKDGYWALAGTSLSTQFLRLSGNASALNQSELQSARALGGVPNDVGGSTFVTVLFDDEVRYLVANEARTRFTFTGAQAPTPLDGANTAPAGVAAAGSRILVGDNLLRRIFAYEIDGTLVTSDPSPPELEILKVNDITRIVKGQSGPFDFLVHIDNIDLIFTPHVRVSVPGFRQGFIEIEPSNVYTIPNVATYDSTTGLWRLRGRLGLLQGQIINEETGEVTPAEHIDYSTSFTIKALFDNFGRREFTVNVTIRVVGVTIYNENNDPVNLARGFRGGPPVTTPGGGRPAISMTVTPQAIRLGENFSISWNTVNAISPSITVDGNPLDVRGTEGITTFRPTAEGTYTVVGVVSNGVGRAETTATVVVGPPPTIDALRIDSFEVDRSQIAPGESATLTWATTRATVEINGASVSADGSQTVSPTETTTYTLAATSTDDLTLTFESSLTVTVETPDTVTPPDTPSEVPAPAVAVRLNPVSILAGETAQLAWSTTNAETVRINGTGAPVNGQLFVRPRETTTYVVEASGLGGTVSRQRDLVVNPAGPAPVAVLEASDTDVSKGDTVALRWTTFNAIAAVLSPDIGTLSPVSMGSVLYEIRETTVFTITAIGTSDRVVQETLTVTVA
ncbi:MAG: hypothetical protein F4103_03465 [Boseongicola sp. SB0673_bin_14]|nr:hypothetical protein [Boseongicola sp. SB0673_bin_14]